MTHNTTHSQSISPVKNLSWRDVHGELVIVEIDTGKYHVFNETAHLIWDSIIDSGSSDQAVNQLVTQYDVDQDTAETDVNKFVTQLMKNQLVNYS